MTEKQEKGRERAGEHMDYLKIEICSEPHPIPNEAWIKAQNEIWEVAKAYRGLSNASKDKDKRFTSEKWGEIIGRINAVIEKYPYPWAEGAAYLLLKELEARDLGGYSLEHAGA